MMDRAEISDVEAEQQHVTVLDDVLLALDAQLARVARAGLAVQRDVVVVSDRFAGDEAALEVLVYDGGGLWRFGTRGDGPGARFFRTAGEISDQPQQIVAGANHPIQPRIMQAEAFEKFRLIGRRQLRDL